MLARKLLERAQMLLLHRRRLACAIVLGLGCGDEASVASSSGSSSESSSSADTTTDATTTGATDDADSTSDDGTESTTDDGSSSSDTDAEVGQVHVVLFTHVEDASPGGMLGSAENLAQYMAIRGRMIEMAELAQSHDLQWVLQPDWKILLAAQQYEDAETMASTNGKNFLRYLVEDLGVVVDAHSHENGGYNYTDVAYLLESLGVGGSTVIGGHIWDPSLPQFSEWDRFREPVAGMMYPEALWRGDILVGSGTPNHVNDPLVSGLWRPLDRDDYFTDDPTGNIVAVGAWHDGAAGVQELVDLYASGTVPADRLLTASWNISPIEIMAPDGLTTIEETTLVPMADLRDAGAIVMTDFTTLVDIWTTDYGGEAFLYPP